MELAPKKRKNPTFYCLLVMWKITYQREVFLLLEFFPKCRLLQTAKN